MKKILFMLSLIAAPLLHCEEQDDLSKSMIKAEEELKDDQYVEKMTERLTGFQQDHEVDATKIESFRNLLTEFDKAAMTEKEAARLKVKQAWLDIVDTSAKK